jgi:hypothetical protein
VAILDALQSNGEKFRSRNPPRYIPATALELQIFMECSKIFGGFVPKKIKEDCDCVIMQWNIMGITVGHKNKE